MLAQRTEFEVPYKALERAALKVLDGDHRDEAVEWLAELGRHVDHVVEGDDRERVLEWAARLDRLAANLPEDPLAPGYLTAMLHRLDRRAAALAQARDVRERGEEAVGVRDRVYAWVAAHPRSRSGEIAERLGIAPSQASRALRELQRRGQVFLAEAGPGDHDGRVHRYIAAEAAHAAA
ncbi:MAG TPA: helix-turn-helix domain-containing protein [Baekduia sp.]|uniref:MarR family transcriptional regulator n=1 Tax=Baekduia sp. TaxID=2600305 RepID=UPI002D77F822|nr:helix-turn-helix domain-containing protein [Baekduia sp.]HET6506759.1 helix-turn-helix domain-containing protein [Baekduia sp.]